MTTPKVPTVVRANGCVLWRRSPEQSSAVQSSAVQSSAVQSSAVQSSAVQYLVIHRPRYDDWSLAKGKLEPNETDLQCAARELLEETGYSATFGPELSSVSYRDHKDRPKMVRYWMAEYDGGEFVVNDEVDEVRWLGHDEAVAALSYEHDHKLISQANELL